MKMLFCWMITDQESLWELGPDAGFSSSYFLLVIFVGRSNGLLSMLHLGLRWTKV